MISNILQHAASTYLRLSATVFLQVLARFFMSDIFDSRKLRNNLIYLIESDHSHQTASFVQISEKSNRGTGNQQIMFHRVQEQKFEWHFAWGMIFIVAACIKPMFEHLQYIAGCHLKQYLYLFISLKLEATLRIRWKRRCLWKIVYISGSILCKFRNRLKSTRELFQYPEYYKKYFYRKPVTHNSIIKNINDTKLGLNITENMTTSKNILQQQ